MTLAVDALKLRETIERSERFLLTGHVNIDGDSLGSMLAMAQYLRSCGKTVRALCFEPILARYSFLEGTAQVEIFSSERHAEYVAAADCFMMFDFSATTRMPGLWDLVKNARARKVCFDHHPAESLPGDLNFHDCRAPATGKIVLDLLRECGARLDRSLAEALLVAIGTDTGWFRYRNTSAEVMRDVADLLACGVDASRVYGEIYQRNETPLLRLMGHVVSDVREECGGRLLWGRIPYALSEELGVGPYETDELLDLMRTGRDAELIALFRETSDGSIRMNLRSRGSIDVGKIAAELGGGGHAYAGGATLLGGFEVASERALAALRRALAPARTPGARVG